MERTGKKIKIFETTENKNKPKNNTVQSDLQECSLNELNMKTYQASLIREGIVIFTKLVLTVLKAQTFFSKP